MNFLLQPWQFLVVVFCGWVHQRQSEIIEFQNDELTALMQRLGKKRLLLTDDQRRLLAVKGKNIGRKALLQLTTMGKGVEKPRRGLLRPHGVCVHEDGSIYVVDTGHHRILRLQLR